MKIGMLWFDNDPHTDLAAKVERAASYYRSKYGKTPTVCFVHPSMLPTVQVEQAQESQHFKDSQQPGKISSSDQTGPETGKPARGRKNSKHNAKIQQSAGAVQASGVEVRANPSVRPHHFWIGVNGVSPVSSTTSTSNDRPAGISPDLTLSSASSKR